MLLMPYILPLCLIGFGVNYSFSLFLASAVNFNFDFAPRFIQKSISSFQELTFFAFFYFYVNWIMIREYAYKSSTFQKIWGFTLRPST